MGSWAGVAHGPDFLLFGHGVLDAINLEQGRLDLDKKSHEVGCVPVDEHQHKERPACRMCMIVGVRCSHKPSVMGLRFRGQG